MWQCGDRDVLLSIGEPYPEQWLDDRCCLMRHRCQGCGDGGADGRIWRVDEGAGEDSELVITFFWLREYPPRQIHEKLLVTYGSDAYSEGSI
jgi:hypothetical protein